MKSSFNRIEERRIAYLVKQWLFLKEKLRNSFEVVAIELSEQVEINGYQFNFKIDRIDEVYPDKKRLMIDYKSGSSSKEDWL